MELQHFEQQLAEAERERERARADMSESKERYERESRRARALVQVVKGLRELANQSPEPQSESPPTNEPSLTLEQAGELIAPRGQEAIRRVMKGSGRDWKPAQVIAEVRDRGWIDPDAKTPEAAIRVALRRAVDAGEVEKTVSGLYRYRDSGESPEEAALAAGGLESTNREGGAEIAAAS
jgi:hypothetical protein